MKTDRVHRHSGSKRFAEIRPFILYCIRWQLSTPILGLFTGGLSWGSMKRAALANLVGACIFFFVDRLIFKKTTVQEWEVAKDVLCCDCGAGGIVMKRLVYDSRGYDRRDDGSPMYRCPECSQQKLASIVFGGRQ